MLLTPAGVISKCSCRQCDGVGSPRLGAAAQEALTGEASLEALNLLNIRVQSHWAVGRSAAGRA